MLTLDDVQLRTQMGSPRPYAAELGIPFDREVYPEELAALLAAEHLEAVFPVKSVLGIMRWMGNFLSQLEIKREQPPEVLTILDYRWVVSLCGSLHKAWDTKSGRLVDLREMAANEPPPETSLAINLHAIWLRRIRPMINHSRIPDQY